MASNLSPVFEFLGHITAFGNSSVLLVVTLLASAWLAMRCYTHTAASLWIAFITTAILIISGKLLFLGCVDGTPYGIRSPSGHAGLSLATYGMLGFLFAQSTQGVLRALLNLILFFLIIAIAFSRIMLPSPSASYHTLPEVVAGLAAGMVGLLIARRHFFNWKQELLRLNVPVMVVVLAGIAFLLHNTNIPAENWIKKLAAQLPHHIEACTQLESQGGNTSRANSSS